MAKQCKYTKDEIIKIIQDLDSKHVVLTLKYLLDNYGNGFYRVLLKEFKSLGNCYKEAGISQTPKFNERSKEEIIKSIKYVYNLYGKVTSALLYKETGISDSAYKHHFKNKPFKEILKEIGIPLKKNQHGKWTKEEAIVEIMKIKEEFGYVSKPLIEKYGEVNTKVIQRIWGNFANMYTELGLKRHPSGIISTDEELLDELKRLYKEFGVVNCTIIVNESKFSKFAFTNRFGGIPNALRLAGIKNPKSGGSIEAAYTINKYAEYLKDEPKFEQTFPWLINPETGMRLRIDGYFPKYKIGIEYNGPQHYHPIKMYCETEKEVKHRKHLDQLKINLCKEHGIEIITVHYKDKVTEEYIKNTINKILLASRTA